VAGPDYPALHRPFRKQGKITLQQIVRLAYSFAHGAAIADTAEAIGISRKSVREEFIGFRERLVKPAFNRWHQTNRVLVRIVDPKQEALIRAAFFDVLGECFLNDTCYRNFAFGNRKRRLCRKCPVPGKFREERDVKPALESIDAVRRFYEQIGWRGETREDPYRLIRRHFIHATVVGTALANTRKLPGQIADPSDTGFLSVRTMAQALLDVAAQGAP